MKRLLFGITLIIMMLSSMLPSYAKTHYTLSESGVNVFSDEAANKKTVLIKKGDKNASEENIVYVNEDTSGFTATTNFLIKETAENGLYTIILGGTGEAASTGTFYIGMNDESGDVKMVKRTSAVDQVANGVRYACMVSGARNFNTVIIKMDGKYFGFKLPESWSISAGESSIFFGVEIIANNNDNVNQITDVWLSERTLDNSGVLTQAQSN